MFIIDSGTLGKTCKRVYVRCTFPIIECKMKFDVHVRRTYPYSKRLILTYLLTIVLTIDSHFKSQNSERIVLKPFYEQLNTNYSVLPTHTPTLDTVLEHMI